MGSSLGIGHWGEVVFLWGIFFFLPLNTNVYPSGSPGLLVQVSLPCSPKLPINGIVFEGICCAAEGVASGQGLSNCPAGQIVGALGEARPLKVGIAFGYFATGNTTGIGVFVVEVN